MLNREEICLQIENQAQDLSRKVQVLTSNQSIHMHMKNYVVYLSQSLGRLKKDVPSEEHFTSAFNDFLQEIDKLVSDIKSALPSSKTDSLCRKKALVLEQGKYMRALYERAVLQQSNKPMKKRATEGLELRGRLEGLTQELEVTNAVMASQQRIIKRKTEENKKLISSQFNFRTTKLAISEQLKDFENVYTQTLKDINGKANEKLALAAQSLALVKQKYTRSLSKMHKSFAKVSDNRTHYNVLAEECGELKQKYSDIRDIVSHKDKEIYMLRQVLNDDQDKLEELLEINNALRDKIEEQDRYISEQEELIEAQFEMKTKEIEDPEIGRIQNSLNEQDLDRVRLAKTIAAKDNIIKQLQEELSHKYEHLSPRDLQEHREKDKILAKLSEITKSEQRYKVELADLQVKFLKIEKENQYLSKYTQELEEIISTLNNSQLTDQEKLLECLHIHEQNVQKLKNAEIKDSFDRDLKESYDKSLIVQQELRRVLEVEQENNRRAQRELRELLEIEQRKNQDNFSFNHEPKELRSLQVRVGELTSSLAEKEKSLSGNLSELLAKDREINSLNSRVEALSEKYTKTKREYKALKSQIEDIKAGLEPTNPLFAPLANKFEDLHRKIKESSLENAELSSEKEQLKKALSSLNKQMKSLELLKQEYEDWKQMNTGATAELSQLRARNSQLELENKELSIFKTRLEAHIDQKDKEHFEEISAFSGYNPSLVSDLRQEIESLKEDSANKDLVIIEKKRKIAEFRQILGSKRAGAVSSSQKVSMKDLKNNNPNKVLDLLSEYERILSECTNEFGIQDVTLLTEAIQDLKRTKDKDQRELHSLKQAVKEIKQILNIRNHDLDYVCKAVRTLKMNENLGLQTVVRECYSYCTSLIEDVQTKFTEKIHEYNGRLQKVANILKMNPNLVEKTGINPLEILHDQVDLLKLQMKSKDEFLGKIRTSLGLIDDSTILIRIKQLLSNKKSK